MNGPNAFRLDGRVAVVTGATRGIGRAVALGLAEAGAAVVVSSRRQESCEKVAAEIAESSGARTLGLACHVAHWDDVPGFVDQVRAEFGRIDVLVNNAGILPALLDLNEMTSDYWRKTFAVNVEGPLRMSQCIAPVMRACGGGSIVNIASSAASSGGTGTAAYAASKAALVNLTKSMALQWVSWDVRVNAVNPGTVHTEMTGVGGADYLASMAARVPMQRVAAAFELVGPVLYLASDASTFVTGDVLSVTGGRGI